MKTNSETNSKISSFAGSFAERVYALCRKIPKGRVTTYKEIGRMLGIRGYQAIGQALRCSPGMPAVPCHRVVCSDGRVGGFKGKLTGKAVREKKQFLEQEGVRIHREKIDLHQYHYVFTL